MESDAALRAAFGRHLDACNNATLPGLRLRLRLGSAPIGYIAPHLAQGLLADLLAADDAGAVRFADDDALQRAARRLAEAGHAIWRDEAFDVHEDVHEVGRENGHEDGHGQEGGRVVARLDRGVLPNFGIAATGVHLNGLVERDGETLLWVARRAADKLLDPGKLDHLAAGGVPAGLSPDETLVKEAQEECGLPPALAATARAVAVIRYAMERPEGLRRDRLRCYDIVLPPDWRPVAVDGEVEAFELWTLPRAFAAVRDGEAFKFNVNLVLIDLFLRRGLIDPSSAAGRALRHGLGGNWHAG